MSDADKVGVLCIEYARRTVVAASEQVESFGKNFDTGDGSSTPKKTADLDTLLCSSDLDNAVASPREQDAAEYRHVNVQTSAGTVIQFTTCADITLLFINRDSLVDIPNVMQTAGCARWVRGMVLLNEGFDSHRSESTQRRSDDEDIGLWVDLVALGDTLGDAQ